MDHLIESHRQQILQLALRRGAKSIRLFGSMARGQAKTTSDVDFLVKCQRDNPLLPWEAC